MDDAEPPLLEPTAALDEPGSLEEPAAEEPAALEDTTAALLDGAALEDTTAVLLDCAALEDPAADEPAALLDTVAVLLDCAALLEATAEEDGAREEDIPITLDAPPLLLLEEDPAPPEDVPVRSRDNTRMMMLSSEKFSALERMMRLAVRSVPGVSVVADHWNCTMVLSPAATLRLLTCRLLNVMPAGVLVMVTSEISSDAREDSLKTLSA